MPLEIEYNFQSSHLNSVQKTLQSFASNVKIDDRFGKNVPWYCTLCVFHKLYIAKQRESKLLKGQTMKRVICPPN